MNKIITVEPLVEPITLEEAKLYCRIDTDDLDSLISSFITSARKYCESVTRKAFIAQSWKNTYDWRDNIFKRREISLNYGILQSVESITTYNAKDEAAIFDDQKYRVNYHRIALLSDAQWPTYLREYDAVEIDYTIGYGDDASSVPLGITNAIKELISFWIELSASTSQQVENGKDLPIPKIIRQLLIPYTQFIA